MTTDATFAVFEDFNDPRETLAPPPVEDTPSPFDELGEIREQAWTDGYLTGRQERDRHGNDGNSAARLLTSVHELDAKASEAVEAASLVVADLLVNAVIAATSENWSARLLDRVRAVADRIKPALTVTPEFVLRDDDGIAHSFGDISALSQALEAGNTGEVVTIRWHRGEAVISRTALLADLRDAIVPLSASQPNGQTARNPL
jgi:hypothetical protein